MIEVTTVIVLTKAIELLYDQVAKILLDCQQRKQPSARRSSAHSGMELQRIIPSQADALQASIRQTSWLEYEAEVKHLVALLDIQSRNYWMAKEQYARWSGTTIPQIVISNLEEEGIAVTQSVTRLDMILTELIKDRLPSPVKEAP